MSLGAPSTPCPKCGHSPADILKLSVVYTTELDFTTGETVHKMSEAKYQLKCPKCSALYAAVQPDS